MDGIITARWSKRPYIAIANASSNHFLENLKIGFRAKKTTEKIWNFIGNLCYNQRCGIVISSTQMECAS